MSVDPVVVKVHDEAADVHAAGEAHEVEGHPGDEGPEDVARVVQKGKGIEAQERDVEIVAAGDEEEGVPEEPSEERVARDENCRKEDELESTNRSRKR